MPYRMSLYETYFNVGVWVAMVLALVFGALATQPVEPADPTRVEVPVINVTVPSEMEL